MIVKSGEEMKIQCDYCGQMIPDTEQTCPYCGAANDKVKRSAEGVPVTIQELKDYCAAHHLPLEDMRVFIGEDYRGAKAFGIYQEDVTGNFVVYKNKGDGSRAVRYEGNDEAYAVNELYMKIRERVIEQKERQKSASSKSLKPSTSSKLLKPSDTEKLPKPKKRSRLKELLQGIFINLIVLFLIGLQVLFAVDDLFPSVTRWIFSSGMSPDKGYYVYDDNTYYYYRSDWYRWDGDSWLETDVDEALNSNYSDYFQSSNWDSDYGVEDFTDSDQYSVFKGLFDKDENDRDDDWDIDWDDDWDDWDWDSGWDSNYDDWDSDW